MTQARDLADGKFDTSTLVVDAANNRVGVGDASPPTALTLGSGTLTIKNASSDSNGLKILQDTSDTAKIINHYNGPMIFSTNNSERGRFLAGGGLTFNGDTAAANALDDYEEGTWTPASTGTATYIEQFGRYRKVGDVVYIMFVLEINNIGTGEQERISGLPFAAARECTIHASKFENINLSIVDGTLRTSNTYLYLTHRTAAAASSTSNSGFLKNNARVQASGWYHISD